MGAGVGFIVHPLICYRWSILKQINHLMANTLLTLLRTYDTMNKVQGQVLLMISILKFCKKREVKEIYLLNT